MPFTAQADTTEATQAADDPTDCYYYGEHTVWFRYTAPADGFVKAQLSRELGQQYAVVAVYTGDRGALSQVPGACSRSDYTGSETFHVTAGETYHIMVFEWYDGLPRTFELATVQAGQTKSIKASVVNTRYDENVEVQLQRKNIHGRYDTIGALKQSVAATAGTVTFRIVAGLPYPNADTNPAGNERSAETTKVRPKAGRTV